MIVAEHASPSISWLDPLSFSFINIWVRLSSYLSPLIRCFSRKLENEQILEVSSCTSWIRYDASCCLSFHKLPSKVKNRHTYELKQLQHEPLSISRWAGLCNMSGSGCELLGYSTSWSRIVHQFRTSNDSQGSKIHTKVVLNNILYPTNMNNNKKSSHYEISFLILSSQLIIHRVHYLLHQFEY